MRVLRLFALALGLGCGTAWADSQSFDMIERGRQLAIIGDCTGCHTAAGGAPFAGGVPIETPFGNVVAPNITPDTLTGIGGWTGAEYLRAMQHGIGRSGEHLYPAFPYPYYARVSQADLLTIRAYLATLDPVRNAVVRNQLAFPFDIRLSMSAWNLLFFDPTPIVPVSGKSAEWQVGQYLVEGLGHCGACHTAKNFAGADRASLALQGGALQDWFAPALTGDLRTGLGSWSVDEVVEYLQTGRNAREAATGPMAEVVTNSTSRMTASDLRAMAVYLKDLPGRGGAPASVAAGSAAMQAGAGLYGDLCAACHTGAGGGIARLFPALRGSAVVQSDDPASLLRVILTGARAVATEAAPTGPAMPGFGWKLTDEQVANLTTYIRNAWGNAASAVSAAEVRGMRGRLAARAGN